MKGPATRRPVDLFTSIVVRSAVDRCFHNCNKGGVAEFFCNKGLVAETFAKRLYCIMFLSNFFCNMGDVAEGLMQQE